MLLTIAFLLRTSAIEASFIAFGLSSVALTGRQILMLVNPRVPLRSALGYKHFVPALSGRSITPNSRSIFSSHASQDAMTEKFFMYETKFFGTSKIFRDWTLYCRFSNLGEVTAMITPG